jgi:heme A synthase
LRNRFGGAIAAALGLLILQIGLGALTVRLLDEGEINPAFVVAHLATAFAFFGTLVATGTHALGQARPPAVAAAPVPALPKLLTLVTLGAVFLQVLIGGLVANMGASMACPEFPSCAGGVWIPSWAGPIGLQIGHRLGALIVSVLVVALFFVLKPYPRAPRSLLAVAVGVVVVQFALGVVTVLLGLPLMARAAHHVMAYALFGTIVSIAYGVLASPPRAQPEVIGGAAVAAT